MTYKCLDCGHIFEEGEQLRWVESHGEEMQGCPKCNGAFEETKQCAICDGEFLPVELNGGVCDECIQKEKHNIKFCFELGEQIGKTEIKINPFLAEMFTDNEIERILLDELKKENADCSPFINEDKMYFGEKLQEHCAEMH